MSYLSRPLPPMQCHPTDVSSEVPIISWTELPSFSIEWLLRKVNDMNLIGLSQRQDLWLLTFSLGQRISGFERAQAESRAWVVPIDLNGYAAIRVENLGRGIHYFQLLNELNPIIRWMCLLRKTVANFPGIVEPDHVEAVWEAASNSRYSMGQLLAKWSNSNSVRPDLKPPTDADGRLLQFTYRELGARLTI